LERALFEVPHQRFQVLFKLTAVQLDADLIDTSLAFIAFYRAKGFVHQLQVDSSRQRVVLDLQWSHHSQLPDFFPFVDLPESPYARAVESVS